MMKESHVADNLAIAYCYDKLSGNIVQIGVGPNLSVAVRRVMVSVMDNHEIQAFPDDFAYAAGYFGDADVSFDLSADDLGKMLEGESHA